MRTLAEWLTLQESVHPKSIDMELTRVAAVARALRIAEPAFPVVTVGGTNGKGSTVAHLAALLAALGASTGMFTSPHFVRYNERIRVNGTEVGDQELIAAFERIEAARGATTLTFFEYNTLAALLIFAQRPRRSQPTTHRARRCAASPSGSRGPMSAPWAQRCARCASPAASRCCRAKWSGFWISRTTHPPPKCSPGSCASARCHARATASAARDGPWRSSACWRTRTPR